ncbi:hypothetical protein J1N35_032587 [Gossypium stocksii]|uniref:RNase H type-1 domain-containing protein n=1 Tax=Gossypium stocksii TaxID=47602 RepID=A0A9D3ZWE1_9ROSI|nr:hypothetical protein J1N35_032587 [Gossypium stocksii]
MRLLERVFSVDVGGRVDYRVELWGILDGLNLTADRCFQKVLIQTDSIEAIKAIMEDDTRISNSTIIRRIHQTLKKLEQ